MDQKLKWKKEAGATLWCCGLTSLFGAPALHVWVLVWVLALALASQLPVRHPGRRDLMAQVLGTLPPTWETWLGSWTWLLWALTHEQMDRIFSISSHSHIHCFSSKIRQSFQEEGKRGAQTNPKRQHASNSTGHGLYLVLGLCKPLCESYNWGVRSAGLQNTDLTSRTWENHWISCVHV